MGVIIPKRIIKELNIHSEEEIIITIEKKKENVLAELFEALPLKESSKEILKEIRKNLESKYI